MARTGRGKNAQKSRMPAMTSSLWEHPIFEYDPIKLHVSRSPKVLEARSRSLVPTPERKPIVGSNDVCWSGFCPGCGRALISATTTYKRSADHHYCTRACRAAHT